MDEKRSRPKSLPPFTVEDTVGIQSKKRYSSTRSEKTHRHVTMKPSVAIISEIERGEYGSDDEEKVAGEKKVQLKDNEQQDKRTGQPPPDYANSAVQYPANGARNFAHRNGGYSGSTSTIDGQSNQ